jgi:DNA-binding transcriptional regulator YiaG
MPIPMPRRSAAETAAAMVRTRLGISQPAFAARCHIPVGTCGTGRTHTALAYLRVIAQEPDLRARALAV